MKNNNKDYTELQLHYLELDEYICENIYPINNIVFTEKINWLKGVAIAGGAIGLGFLINLIAKQFGFNILQKLNKLKSYLQQLIQGDNIVKKDSEKLKSPSTKEEISIAVQNVFRFLIENNYNINYGSIENLSIDDFKNYIDSIENKKKETEQLLDKISEETKNKENLLTAIDKKKEQYTKELNDRKDSLDNRESQIKKDEEQIEKDKKQIEKDKEQIKKAEEDLTARSNELADKDIELQQDYQKKVEELKNQNQKEQEEFRKKQTKDYENEMNNLSNEFQKAKDKAIIAASNEYKRKIEEFEKKTSDFQQTINNSNLISLTDELTKSNTKLASTQQALNAETEILKNIASQLGITIDVLKNNPEIIKKYMNENTFNKCKEQVKNKYKIQKNMELIKNRIIKSKKIKVKKPKNPEINQTNNTQTNSIKPEIIIPPPIVNINNKECIDDIKYTDHLKKLADNVSNYIYQTIIQLNSQSFENDYSNIFTQQTIKINDFKYFINKLLKELSNNLYVYINSIYSIYYCNHNYELILFEDSYSLKPSWVSSIKQNELKSNFNYLYKLLFDNNICTSFSDLKDINTTIEKPLESELKNINISKDLSKNIMNAYGAFNVLITESQTNQVVHNQINSLYIFGNKTLENLLNN